MGCGRAGAWDAAHRRAAESAQADFANFQRRIHSLQRADGTFACQDRDECRWLVDGRAAISVYRSTVSAAACAMATRLRPWALAA